MKYTMSQDSSCHAEGQVCAVVVTFNRKEWLRKCLRALEGQSRAIDHILVIDNASTDGTPEVFDEFPSVEVVRLTENTGGSGGFYEGFKLAYAAGYDWLWVMDDDGIPNPDCLELLLSRATPKGVRDSVVLPVQQGLHALHGILGWRGGHQVDLNAETLVPVNSPEGTPPLAAKDRIFSFVGPLIPRSVVKKVGLPNPEYFIWFDDWEYSMRISRRTKTPLIVVPQAIFHHEPGIETREVRLLGLGKPTQRPTCAIWRLYYRSRNALYTMLHTRRRWSDTLLYLLYQVRALTAIMLYDPDRWPRAAALLRGLKDGALGRMGKRH